MDSEKLQHQIKSRFDHAQARKLLKEKYEAKLTFAAHNGMWKAGPGLITVLKCCSNETAVIVDLYGNPVMVNVASMLTEVQGRWQEQMNAWLVEFNQLNKQR